MFVKVEPSGCCERKGMVQIRFCMFLDEGDYGYDKHHVQVPERDLTEAEIADPELAAKVPRVWQVNPFHNHFIYVEPDTADGEIMDIGEAFLHEAYIKWACEQKLDLVNPPIERPTVIDNTRIDACEAKVQHLKENVLERKV